MRFCNDNTRGVAPAPQSQEESWLELDSDAQTTLKEQRISPLQWGGLTQPRAARPPKPRAKAGTKPWKALRGVGAEVHGDLIHGEITLPRRDADDRMIDEAIALDKGPVVYQIVKKRPADKNKELRVSYRALPQKSWEQISALPRAQWPLVPHQIAAKERARRSIVMEAAILGLLGGLLCLGIVHQNLEIAALQKYSSHLKMMMAKASPASAAFSSSAASAAAPVLSSSVKHPQEHWVCELNAITQALAPVGGRLSSFEFIGAGNGNSPGSGSAGIEFQYDSQGCLSRPSGLARGLRPVPDRSQGAAPMGVGAQAPQNNSPSLREGAGGWANGAGEAVDVESLLRKALGKDVNLVKEGLWSWRE